MYVSRPGDLCRAAHLSLSLPRRDQTKAVRLHASEALLLSLVLARKEHTRQRLPCV